MVRTLEFRSTILTDVRLTWLGGVEGSIGTRIHIRPIFRCVRVLIRRTRSRRVEALMAVPEGVPLVMQSGVALLLLHEVRVILKLMAIG